MLPIFLQLLLFNRCYAAYLLKAQIYNLKKVTTAKDCNASRTNMLLKYAKQEISEYINSHIGMTIFVLFFKLKGNGIES